MNEKEINEILKELSSINLKEEEPTKTFFQKHRNTIILALLGGAAGKVRNSKFLKINVLNIITVIRSVTAKIRLSNLFMNLKKARQKNYFLNLFFLD